MLSSLPGSQSGGGTAGRILWLYPFGPDTAGFQSRVLPWTEAISSAGTESTVYSTMLGARPLLLWSADKRLPHRTFSGRSRLSISLPHDIHMAVSGVLYFGIGRFFPPPFRVTDFAVALSYAELEAETPIAVVCQKPFFRTVVPALKIARDLRIPCVLDIDDYDVTPKARFLSRFDTITVASKALMDVYAQWNPILVSNAPDRFTLAHGPRNIARSSTSTKLVFVYPGPGLPFDILAGLLDSLGSLSREIDVSVVGCPRSALARIGMYQPSDRMTIWPKLCREDLLDLISTHDIALCIDPASRYGLAKGSIRLVEAMSLGLAVISWDIGETGRIVRDSGGGLTVSYGDFRALVSSVLTLASDRDRLESCARSARGFMNGGRSWGENARSLLSAIRRT